MENEILKQGEMTVLEKEELRKVVQSIREITVINKKFPWIHEEVKHLKEKCEALGNLPDNEGEALNYLNTYAQFWCATRVKDFISEYPDQHESDIKREVERIEGWRNFANDYQFFDREWFELENEEKFIFVFQRIIAEDFIKYFVCNPECIMSYPEFAEKYVSTYGEFFLFYEYLKSKVESNNYSEAVALPENDSDFRIDISKTENHNDNGATPPEKDYLLSTIEKYIFPFKDKMPEQDYKTLCIALKQYFTEGNFPAINKPIQVKKVNIKSFGWALNGLYRSQKNNKLPDEYLQFAKDNISIFKGVKPENLYKYFTTKTPETLTR